MKFRIKKNLVGLIAFSLIVASFPLAYGAYQGGIMRGFSAELWISNQNPTMALDSGLSYVYSSVDPLQSSNVLVWFIFNVTDPDGEDNIDETGTDFNLTLGSRTDPQARYRFNSSCINISKLPLVNRVVFNCSVYLQYYDNASSNWVINGTAKDVNNALAVNDTNRLTYNTLSALSLPRTYLNWSSVNLGQNDQATASPLILNNTGNDVFDQINITASPLVGVTTPGESIPVTNFAVNNTNAISGFGMALSTSAQTIKEGDTDGNLTLYPATDFLSGNVSLFFWVDVPAVGLSAQKYNATWNISVVNN